jgi:hypothetical protein
MGRIHLIDFKEQLWYAGFLQKYGTDFLQFISSKKRLLKPIVIIIKNIAI